MMQNPFKQFHESKSCQVGAYASMYYVLLPYMEPVQEGHGLQLKVGYNRTFRKITKYDRTCSSASGMLWRENKYNFIQRVTKSYNLAVNLVYNFTRVCSKIWKKI